ncbi:MAG: SEC-C domain-containing protein, partial [Oscillospiraceae bacterium]|nr:SEC-C domain-containing protein [Oscillospiraceae bacterium]
DLKQGVQLRAYGQTDPVIAYKKEGYEMFDGMISAIREETVRRLFALRIKPKEELKRRKVATVTAEGGSASSRTVKRQPARKAVKIGPNDPCPCGSGKKYKKCCRDKDLAAHREPQG